MISPLAYIHPEAKIGENVEIAPFVFIDKNVVIGDNNKIMANANILYGSRIGNGNTIFPGAVIGAIPQDLKFRGEESTAEIGDNNLIRENVTINRGTAAKGRTIVGNNNLLMEGVHVAHDALVGNGCIIGNSTKMAGEIVIDDNAIVSANVLMHQFCHVGSHVMIQGGDVYKRQDNILVSSTIGRNKLLIPGEVSSAIINGTDELLAELREMGVGVYATGGETADVGDLVRTIIVDSTVTCRMKRSDVIDNANIRPGDVIVGLASYGQATYEKEYNGGMGSNGLTSARHDVFGKYLAEKYPESYDAAVPEELVYSGKLKLTDSVEDSPINAGKLVLSPTRTYAPVVKKLLDALRPEIHGMVHCSGGAQTKVLHFVENVRVVKDNLFPVPPLFKTIQEQSGTDWAEMYKVFNMGHRLEVYLSPEHAEEVIAISESFGIPAQIVGRVEACEQTELIIKSEFGEFRY